MVLVTTETPVGASAACTSVAMSRRPCLDVNSITKKARVQVRCSLLPRNHTETKVTGPFGLPSDSRLRTRVSTSELSADSFRNKNITKRCFSFFRPSFLQLILQSPHLVQILQSEAMLASSIVHSNRIIVRESFCIDSKSAVKLLLPASRGTASLSPRLIHDLRPTFEHVVSDRLFHGHSPHLLRRFALV